MGTATESELSVVKDEVESTKPPNAELETLRRELAEKSAELEALHRQAGERSIALAAARVQSQAVAMESSADLLQVVGSAYQEMSQLGIPVYAFAVQVDDVTSGESTRYVARTSPRKFGLTWSSPDLADFREGIVVGKDTSPAVTRDIYTEASSGGSWTQTWSSQQWADIQERSVVNRFGIEGDWSAYDAGEVTVVFIPFKHGLYWFIRPVHHVGAAEEVAKLFAEAVTLGSMRFLDFRVLEGSRRQLIDHLESELQTAHDLQMRLMPVAPPRIPGLDIAGRCVPARQVCGDFFQFYEQSGRLSVCIADVTGHAMGAAIPAVMFSGVLNGEMRHDNVLEQTFRNLNRTLFESLDRRTYVCFAMAELDLGSRNMLLANAGFPHPYHFHHGNGSTEELAMGAYPLGIQRDARYTTRAVQLGYGDYVVFMSDGFAEATDAGERCFGFERITETIQGCCRDQCSVEEVVDQLIHAVHKFVGGGGIFQSCG